VATKVNGVSATRIAAGNGFTVAIADHSAVAWGLDTSAQLGHAFALDTSCGSATCNASPIKVDGLPGTK
jgi:hypothetical protein